MHKQQKQKLVSGTTYNWKVSAQQRDNQQNEKAAYRMGENVCK